MIETIRLEILKLVHRGDKHPDMVIKDAQIYEQYIIGHVKTLVPKEEFKSPDKKKGFFNSKSKDDNLF